ncbi:MAG: hypothetical protein AAB520_01215 [Patescibacteria group bacterium]
MVENKQITLTYLNIRQSISILITKLIFIDLILAVIIIGFYFALITGEQLANNLSLHTSLFLSAFGALGIIKIFLGCYVVLKWLNEYYEITPEFIVHKTDIIFKKQVNYRIDLVRSINVFDTFIGELLNFGTITLYDVRLNKYLDMYLIHNPRRYAKVLKELLPHLEIEEDRVWIPGLKRKETPIFESYPSEKEEK